MAAAINAGATLGKGFNRMMATLLAGGLGAGAHRLATLTGRSGEPVLIAIFVFIIGTYTYMYLTACMGLIWVKN